MGMLDGLQPASMVAVCKVTLIVNSLEDNDAKILTEALEDLQKWSSHALSGALGARGITITRETLATHRRRACRCYRSLA
jgi:hypothetical protein